VTNTFRGWVRWIYLPYVFVLALLGAAGSASGESPSGLWPYLVPLPIFVVQLVRPTTVGWRVAFASWFICCFVGLLLEVELTGADASDCWFRALFGLAPLVPLYVFRPRRAAEPGVEARGRAKTERSG